MGVKLGLDSSSTGATARGRRGANTGLALELTAEPTGPQRSPTAATVEGCKLLDVIWLVKIRNIGLVRSGRKAILVHLAIPKP